MFSLGDNSMTLTPIEKAFVYISRAIAEVAASGGKHVQAVRYEIGVDGSGGLLFEADKGLNNETLRLAEKKFGSVRWSRYEDTWVLITLKEDLIKIASKMVNVDDEVQTKV